jgi:hypothetical protein
MRESNPVRPSNEPPQARALPWPSLWRRTQTTGRSLSYTTRTTGHTKARLLRVAISREMNEERQAAAAETATSVVDVINVDRPRPKSRRVTGRVVRSPPRPIRECCSAGSRWRISSSLSRGSDRAPLTVSSMKGSPEPSSEARVVELADRQPLTGFPPRRRPPQ